VNLLPEEAWHDVGNDGGVVVGNSGPFSDHGVKILLQNNRNLEEVGLHGFPLTDISLQYFSDYIRSHGQLHMLSLSSRYVTRFTEAAKAALRTIAAKRDAAAILKERMRIDFIY
jgi:hypothetical protein